jgi:UDP-2,4-diacetamido-2,4,6-trideoxy-beta-L-altropyranose hydrolase
MSGVAPRFVIRADGSHHIGAGHVMRMLALAEGLKAAGASPVFLMRPLSNALIEKVTAAGFAVSLVGQSQDDTFVVNPDAERQALETVCDKHTHVIVDHYGYTTALLDQCCDLAATVTLLDDYQPARCTDRLACIINVNFANTEKPYPVGVPSLLGPRYALLRSAFHPDQRPAYIFRPRCQRVLVCFGGSDKSGMTHTLLTLLNQLPQPLIIQVVTGWEHRQQQALQALAKASPHQVQLVHAIDAMADTLLQQDLAILPASTLSLEAAALQVPTALVVCEDNQMANGLAMQAKQAALLLGTCEDWQPDQALLHLHTLLNNPKVRQQMAWNAGQQADGRGVERVVAHLFNHTIHGKALPSTVGGIL